MQQAVRDLNFPQNGGRGGNTVPADREVADGWAAASNHAGQDTSAVVGRASPGSAESVRPGGAGRQLGKTRSHVVQGREMMADAARAVGKHTERIPPCRDWFALFILCQPEGAEGELTGWRIWSDQRQLYYLFRRRFSPGRLRLRGRPESPAPGTIMVPRAGCTRSAPPWWGVTAETTGPKVKPT